MVLKCLPRSESISLSSEASPSCFNYILETEIIDTGVGINMDRQKMLFVPFLELKIKQNLKKIDNYSVGMGLACSAAISKALGGDIILKKSKRGLTSFAFKIPVIKISTHGPG